MTQTKAELLQTRHQGDIRLGDADSTNYVGFKAPATVGSNLIWTLPATDGSANQFLQTNASGVLGWGTADVSSAMPLTGGTFTGNVTYNDNVQARFGTGSDLSIYHSGTNTFFENTLGNIYFRNDGAATYFQMGSANDDAIALSKDGPVILYYDGSQKFQTTNTGVSITGAATISTNLTVTGDLTVSGTTTTINTQTLDVEDKNVVIGKVSSPSDTTADGGGWTLKGATDKTFNWVNSTDAWTSSEHIHLLDNKKLIVGTGGSDLTISHDGTNSLIDNNTGNLNIQSGGTIYLTNAAGSEVYAQFSENGAASLRYDNTTRLATTSGGINVTGAIQVNGAALSTAPQITATADGAITAGDTVIVNTNGTVKKAQVLATELGTYTSKENTPGNSSLSFRAITYDENADHIITIYARNGSLRATSFAFSDDYSSLDTVTTDYQVANYDPENLAICYSPDLQKSLVIWNQYAGTGDIYSTFLTSTASGFSDSGDTVLAGEKHSHPSICYDTANDKFILISNDRTAQRVEYRVISISGSTPSVDSTGTISGATTGTNLINKVVYDNTNNRVYVYRGQSAGSNAGGMKLHIGSLSGTTMTWHNTVVVNTGQLDSDYLDMCWMPDVNKLALFYSGTGANIKAHVGTPTGSGGTSSMTIGSAFDVDPAGRMSCTYDPLLQRVVVFYIKNSDSHGYAKSLSVSGTSFSLGKDLGAYYAADLNYVTNASSVTYTKTAQQRVVTSYQKQSQTTNTVVAIKTANTATNLTTENYVGIAAASASDSASATIDVSGATNSSQSSLTAGQKYFVQNDGSLGLTAATPAVFAGTAISATKLIVNDQQPVPAEPVSQGWTKVGSGTANSGTDIELYSGFEANKYIAYKILYFFTTGGGQQQCQLGNSGGYITSNTAYIEMKHYGEAGSNRVGMVQNSGLTLPDSTKRNAGEVTIYDPNYAESGGGVMMTWTGFASTANTGNYWNSSLFAGCRGAILDTDSAMTKVRFKFDQSPTRFKWTVYGVGEIV